MEFSVSGFSSSSAQVAVRTIAHPPSVMSQCVLDLAVNTATLIGSITWTGGENPEIAGFNYGLTTSYGSQAIVTGDFGLGSFSAGISGLAPGILYHFQAWATNSGGTGLSADATFTTMTLIIGAAPVTPALPPTLTGLALIEENFLEAFEVALAAGGQTMDFAFSDGVTTDGRIYA